MALYIVLAIGADDVFVFMDAWRQARNDPMVGDNLYARMVVTFRRTASAVFNTSLTTTVAFLATGVSPVMPINAFGIFAALAIAMNYVLVCTWWPAVVVVWEVWFRRARFCGCCCIGCSCCPKACLLPKNETALMNTAGPPAVAPEVEPSAKTTGTAWADDSLAEKSRPPSKSMEGFFYDWFAPMLTWAPVKSFKFFKPASLFFVFGIGAMATYLTAEAFTMTPPTEQEQYFPPDHMFTGIFDEFSNNFLAGAEDSYTTGALYLGLSSLDGSEVTSFPGMYTPDQNRGTVSFDPTFDLSSREAQTSFLQLCADLRVAPCGEAGAEPHEGCSKPPRTLVDPASVDCLLEEFATHLGVATGDLPTGESFSPALLEWLESDDGRDYRRDAGFVRDDATSALVLRFARIRFETTVLRLQPSFIVRPVYEEFVKFADAYRATAPPALATCFPFAGLAFQWLITQEQLVWGMFLGFMICFPVAFVVLVFATGSILVSLYAILSIVGIVGSLLGFTKVALGWTLGTSESIAGTICIGLAVDYTVHLGHVYTESKEKTREGKTRDALAVMGVTVVAGGVTTLGCAAFMFTCTLTFFSSMATLIGGTIFFSLLFALFFFMPLCALIGPQGEIKSVGERVRALCGGGTKKQTAV